MTEAISHMSPGSNVIQSNAVAVFQPFFFGKGDMDPPFWLGSIPLSNGLDLRKTNDRKIWFYYYTGGGLIFSPSSHSMNLTKSPFLGRHPIFHCFFFQGSSLIVLGGMRTRVLPKIYQGVPRTVALLESVTLWATLFTFFCDVFWCFLIINVYLYL